VYSDVCLCEVQGEGKVVYSDACVCVCVCVCVREVQGEGKVVYSDVCVRYRVREKLCTVMCV